MNGEGCLAGPRAGATGFVFLLLSWVIASLWPPAVISQVEPSVPCGSQPLPTEEITLAQAVDWALCRNADIQSAAATVRIRAAQLGQERAQYWPTVSGSATELRETTQYPGSRSPTSSDTATTVYGALTSRLLDFGGRRATVRAASELLAAAFASQDAKIQKVLATVVQGYFDAVTARALMNAKAEDRTLADQTVNSANHRLLRGNGAQSDALQAQSALARAELELNRTRAAYEKALAVLTYATGLPIGVSIEVPLELQPSPTPDMKQALTAWVDAARRSHPAIVAARADVEAAEAQVTAARSSGRPTLDFQANYYANGFPQQGLAANRQRSTTLGITIAIPLFDGFLTRYRVHEAEATVSLKEAALIDTERVTLTDIVSAYADATAAVSNLTAARDLLQAASAAQASSERRYEAGATDILELLTTQATLSDARQERIRSAADWRSARLRLLATSSLLTTDGITRD
jgi:outer membrane protein